MLETGFIEFIMFYLIELYVISSLLSPETEYFSSLDCCFISISLDIRSLSTTLSLCVFVDAGDNEGSRWHPGTHR